MYLKEDRIQDFHFSLNNESCQLLKKQQVVSNDWDGMVRQN